MQQSSSPSRERVKWPWSTTLLDANPDTPPLRQRLNVIDPPLSAREKDALSKECDGPDAPAGRVKWNSGKYGYRVQKNSPFWLLSKVTGLPMSAGVSGSTYTLMATAETLGLSQEELILLRLVYIGWQINFQDHTLLEVSLGAARSFAERSVPRWGKKPKDANDWLGVYRRLVPPDFNFQGVTKDSLNTHIEDYIKAFNKKHGTSVPVTRKEWPGHRGASRWWEHEVFDFMLDDIPILQGNTGSLSEVPPCAELAAE